MTSCVYCNQPVQPDGPNTYRLVSGWERKAYGGTRRGGSDIVLREPQNQFACWTCVDRKKHGVAPNQGALI